MLRFRTSKVKKLIEALNHEDPSVRQRAIGDLGRIGEWAVEPLIGALRDEDEHVRNWAARALAAEPDPRAVEPLIGALHDQRVSVREGAALALGQFDDARAVKALRDAKFKSKQDSKDKPKQVQGVLVMSRLRLGNREALLQQILDEQRLAGHSFASNSVATASVGDFDDAQYVYASLREVFSAFGGDDLMKRTIVKSFQGSDGNSGKYFVVFDRP